MKWIKRYLWQRKKNRALRKIREGFAFWGIFMVDITDEQLERKVIDLSHLYGGICFTAEEAMEVLRKLKF